MALRHVALLAVGCALTGCAGVLPQHPSHARTAPHPTKSKSAPRHLPPGLHVSLPPAGFAVSRGHSVVLYTLAGKRIRVLSKTRIVEARFDRHPWLRDSQGRYLQLTGGKAEFRSMRAPEGPIEADGSNCIVTDAVRGATVKVCAKAGRHLRTHLTVTHGGHRLRLPRHPPQLPGGNWEYGILSPNGQQLLAQWTGECEVPQPYLVNVGTGAIEPIGNVRALQAPEGYALGWTPAGVPVVDFPTAACGSGAKSAGVYLVSLTGRLGHELIATRGQVLMWS
jgi:hypothetical protein